MSGTVTFFREGRPVPSIRMGYLPPIQQNRQELPLPRSTKSCCRDCGKAFGSVIPRHSTKPRGTCSAAWGWTLADRPIGRLSGGQLQRALLGRAIISQLGRGHTGRTQYLHRQAVRNATLSTTGRNQPRKRHHPGQPRLGFGTPECTYHRLRQRDPRLPSGHGTAGRLARRQVQLPHRFGRTRQLSSPCIKMSQT